MSYCGLSFDVQAEICTMICNSSNMAISLCFSCPFANKLCGNVKKQDWLDYFDRQKDSIKNKQSDKDDIVFNEDYFFNICRLAIEKYGIKQLDIVQEELAELVVAISHYKRCRGDKADTLIDVAREWSDCLIMLHQLAIFFEDNKYIFFNALKEKTERLRIMLERQEQNS